MPRIMIDVSSEWYTRFQNGIADAITTLQAIDHRILHQSLEGTLDADQLLDEIHGTLRQLARNLETWRLPF